MSPITTLPAPTTEFAPIVTPGHTITPAASHTLSPRTIGAANSQPARPGLVVVNGMQRRNKLCAWTDRHVVADRDRRTVQQDRVVVDEATCADGYVRTVITLESGKYDRAFT